MRWNSTAFRASLGMRTTGISMKAKRRNAISLPDSRSAASFAANAMKEKQTEDVAIRRRGRWVGTGASCRKLGETSPPAPLPSPTLPPGEGETPPPLTPGEADCHLPLADLGIFILRRHPWSLFDDSLSFPDEKRRDLRRTPAAIRDRLSRRRHVHAADDFLAAEAGLHVLPRERREVELADGLGPMTLRSSRGHIHDLADRDRWDLWRALWSKLHLWCDFQWRSPGCSLNGKRSLRGRLWRHGARRIGVAIRTLRLRALENRLFRGSGLLLRDSHRRI